ncbi:MAG: nitrilase family protein [Alistipes sp.]|nr:nitrilase family protein [Alistipes sp.]
MKSRVAIVQRDIAWRDVDGNLRALERMFEGLRVDVVVLSEMFQTGFVTTPADVADDGATLRWMVTMAKRLDAAIVGSVVVKEADGYHNRMYFVKPTGDVAWYDKRHLFIGDEADNFVHGTERRVVEWRGVRYLLEVCYDLRFPVWSRQRGDYDAIIYSALWPKPRREVWRTLLRARAIENQAYVIGVNRIGSEPGLEYAGDSAVVDAYGRTMADLAECEAVEVVELDMDALAAFRVRFNVLADADSFVIK